MGSLSLQNKAQLLCTGLQVLWIPNTLQPYPLLLLATVSALAVLNSKHTDSSFFPSVHVVLCFSLTTSLLFDLLNQLRHPVIQTVLKL